MKSYAHLHFFCGKATLEHNLNGMDVNRSLELQPNPLRRALWSREEDKWVKGMSRQSRDQDSADAVECAGHNEDIFDCEKGSSTSTNHEKRDAISKWRLSPGLSSSKCQGFHQTGARLQIL